MGEAIRNDWQNAPKGINVTLAEMRAASNDSRRARSIEEKQASAELRRVADEAVDRVKQLLGSLEVKSDAPVVSGRIAVASFHTLPMSVKLRILLTEKGGWAALVVAAMSGVFLVLIALLEIKTAWGCYFICNK